MTRAQTAFRVWLTATLLGLAACGGGGTITASGVYSAPALPGTFTVKATALADGMTSATTSVPVVLPEGHIAGYDVGADYHATGADFVSTAFISQYDTPAVRQTVRTQLQGVADRGATLISTRIWLVEEPGSMTPRHMSSIPVISTRPTPN